MISGLAMVFSDVDKAIIHHYHEEGFTSHKICKDNPEKAGAKHL